MLQQRVARLQRRQFDGNARGLFGRAARRGGADDVDGMFIRLEIALRIGLRARAFAQHIERTQPHVRFARAARQRLFDAAPDHEFTADDAHGSAHGQTHQGLAGFAGELSHPPGGIGLDGGIQLENAAGEHQSPGRGIDEQRLRLAGVGRPVAGSQLFGDQTIRGGIIGNAQQRLSDAHERNAFLIRQSKFLQEGVEKRPFVPTSTRALDQCHGRCHGAMARAAGEFQCVQQVRHRPIFRPFAVIADRLTQLT